MVTQCHQIVAATAITADDEATFYLHELKDVWLSLEVLAGQGEVNATVKMSDYDYGRLPLANGQEIFGLTALDGVPTFVTQWLVHHPHGDFQVVLRSPKVEQAPHESPRAEIREGRRPLSPCSDPMRLEPVLL
jgi:hypothetical protein